MATPATTPATSTSTPASTPAAADILPQPSVLLQAAKIAIEQDRDIKLDYYRDTAKGTAFLGEDKDNKQERVLVKSKDEFTSLVKKFYKVDNDYIVLTENSLYIVSGKIQRRQVNLSSLHDAAFRDD